MREASKHAVSEVQNSFLSSMSGASYQSRSVQENDRPYLMNDRRASHHLSNDAVAEPVAAGVTQVVGLT